MKEKLVLIDGHSILNRAFYGIPDLTTTKGEHTNAILGFINIMLNIIEEEAPQYLTVAFDLPGPTFRHEMFDEYKGTRKGMPDELRQQVPVMKEVLMAMNISTIEEPGFEADDLLGTLACQAEKNGYIVSVLSGDRDLLQLASKKIKVRIPTTKGGKTTIEDYYAENVVEKYRVTPQEFIDLKGLMGDSSDNIPGVPGVGIKTATKLIEKYGSIEKLYQEIDKMKASKVKESLIENQDLAKLSKVLATIKVDCELEYDIKTATIDEIFNEESFEYFKRLEFKDLLTRFQEDIDHSSEIEESFILLKDRKEFDEITQSIEKNKKNKYIGLAIIEEKGQLLGVSLCLNKNKTCMALVQGDIDEKYIEETILNLANDKVRFSIIGLKDVLKFIKFKEEHEVFDNLIAAYLLNPLKKTYHYDDIARDYLNITVLSQKEFLGKINLTQAREEDIDGLLKTSSYEAYVAAKSREALIDKLKEQKMLDLFYDMEIPLVFTLFEMEERGIGINKEELKKYGESLVGGIEKLEKQIHDLAGEEFNINSPKQLGVILFEKLQLPFAKKTKTGYSTAISVLDKLRGDYEIVDYVLEYRTLAKLKSTYADGLADYISPQGRIHSHFNQTITATGRISSTEPNLQNIPIKMELGRQIRKVFIPKDDYVFLDADYSQIELRVLAHMSGDEKLIEAYKNGQDIHRTTASEVFNTPFEEVTDSQRNNAKAVNFGIIYGISAFGLSKDLKISRKEAEEYIQQYFITYPRIKEFLDELVEDAKNNNYAISLFARRRPIPELTSSNFMQRSFGERAAMNSPIQGTAADIMKIAMIAVNKELKKKKMKSQLILQIHDELLIETHKSEIEEVGKIMKDAMENAVELLVPLYVDVKQGKNWYDTI